MLYRYLIVAAMSLFLYGNAEAQSTTMCLPNSFLSNSCASGIVYTISSGKSIAVNTKNTKVVLLTVIKGSVNVGSEGGLSGSSIYGNSYSGDMVNIFTPGSYYFVINGQDSYNITASEDSTVNIANITELNYITNNVANIGGLLASLDMESKGSLQYIKTVDETLGDYIPSSMINSPNGVAGLDSLNNITSNISTDKILLNYEGNALAQMFGSYDDSWTPNWMIRYGALQSGEPVSMQIYGIPDGPNDSGSVMSVGATDSIFTSMRPGIGPDALSSFNPSAIAAYGSLDGAVFTNQFDTPVPLVRVGAEIKDWKGVTHTVTFGCDSNNNRICFTPALPAEWVALIHRGENIMTNVIGPGPASSTDNSYHIPNVLASQIDQVDPNGLYVDTVGWAVPGSGISNGFIPMLSSYAGDSSHPSVNVGQLDTTWSNYSSPVVFFGAVTSMFSNYGYCKLNHSGSHDDAKNINAVDSMVHACTMQQFDVFNSDKDYLNSFGGWGIAYQGPNKPSSDSQMIWLSGSVPTYNRYRYVDTGTRLFDTTAGFNVDYPLPLPTDGTLNWQSQRFMQANEVSVNGIALKLQSWGQMDTALPDGANEAQSVATASVHLGLNYGSGPNTHTVDGNNIGQIIFNANCNSDTGGIALGAGGTGPSSPNIGICVNSSGNLIAPNGMDVINGADITFRPSDTSSGWSYLYADSGTSIALKRTLDGKGADLTIGQLTDTGIISNGEIDINNSSLVIKPADISSGWVYMQAASGTSLNILRTLDGKGADISVGSIIATGLQSSGAITIENAGSLSLAPADPSNGQPYMYADSNSDIKIASSGNGGLAGITASEITSTGPVVFGTYSKSSLPTWITKDAIAECSDCKLNGVTGVLAYWHSSSSTWTDSQNNELAN